MKFKLRFCSLLLVTSLIMVGCAGRDPNVIPVRSSFYGNLNCADLDQQIQVTNAAMLDRAREANSTTNQNIVFGAVGLLLFWPALFALDLKDAGGHELNSYEGRNMTLAHLAEQKNCETETAYSAEQAISIVADQEAMSIASASDSADATQEDQQSAVSTDSKIAEEKLAASPAHSLGRTPEPGTIAKKPRGHKPTTSIAKAPAPVQSTKTGAASSMKDLMRMFLRGEISQSEYEEQRMALKRR